MTRRARITSGLGRLAVLLCAGLLASAAAFAQSPVTLTVGAPDPARRIPSRFVGLSFETSNVRPYPDGTYQFSTADRQLVTLFRNIGIRHLRIGGGTAEPKTPAARRIPRFQVPGPRDIDQLFAFAAATDVKVIYTLRLLNGDPRQDAAIARYIAEHYAAHLDSFSLGNEPDWHAYHTYPGHPLDPRIRETEPGVPGSAFPSYLRTWRAFAAAVREAVPDAKFSGPDTGSNWPVAGGKDTGYEGRSWTENFARAEQGAGLVTAILAHDYVGQGPTGVTQAAAIAAMLSRQWDAVNYPALYDRVLSRVQALGFGYRLTECNDHTGGIRGASNAFAGALWALDYLHWHAAHGALGLDFHNNRWLANDTIYRTRAGDYEVYPKAYGLKAFSLGSHGAVAPVTVANPDHVNVTAYAIVGARDAFVTVINKEYGPHARGLALTIAAPAGVTSAAVIRLTAPDNSPSAIKGVTLGGGSIRNDRPWDGRWTSVAATAGRFVITVPATSAAVIRIPRS